MRRLSVDISSFKTLITENYVYVDKTRDIYALIKAGRYHFLARPRRFGKTLLISTLEELFGGNRDLFKGLWIDSSDYVWEQYPVISLNFSTIDSSSPESFKSGLALELDDKAEELSLDVSQYRGAERKIKKLVHHLAKKHKVVILIDEYDYPIVNNIQNAEVRDKNLKVLSDFFTAIKGLDKHLKALFITGVSQIPKASIFSGLNNLNNISLKPLAATLLGYTKEEVLAYFSQDIAQLALLKNTSQEEMLATIQQWYNGYRFSERDEKVYNPFSLHYLFLDKKFTNYWFQSATPSFLLELLKKNDFVLEQVEGMPIPENSLISFTMNDPQLPTLLFQTGYLTISSYDEKSNTYTLAYPNREVEQSYNLSLVTAVTHKNEIELSLLVRTMHKAFTDNDLVTLCISLNTIFARIPYQIDKREEAVYHLLFQSFLSLFKFESYSEVSANKGRIDLVVLTNNFIYLFELKIDASAASALQQIEDRRYYERYLTDEKKRRVVLVGLAFNKKDAEAMVTCAHRIIPSIT